MFKVFGIHAQEVKRKPGITEKENQAGVPTREWEDAIETFNTMLLKVSEKYTDYIVIE